MPNKKIAYTPAPELCQGADEDLIIKMGEFIFPDFLHRNSSRNGLCLKIEGDYKDDSLSRTASDRFQILLGILRAWNPVAGKRKDEIRPGIGPGSIMDDRGNQIIKPESVITYASLAESKVKKYAQETKLASERSRQLHNALWLNGRRDRNAADFYMIYEYAEKDFQGRKGIVEALRVTDNDLERLKSSANNLAPIDGGRHASDSGTAEWGLDDQKKFIARFLKAWITYRAHNERRNTISLPSSPPSDGAER